MSDIKVKAKFAVGKFGWHDNRRIRDGDEFTIDEKLFSKKWMVLLEGPEPEVEEVAAPKPKVKKAPSVPKAPQI